jgi:two-component system, OmpR family, sensor histidine kinase KdpD
MTSPVDPRRPDPDALLALAGGTRGRLTVFLGAAPGVGKTFAMLNRARRLNTAGIDIVVGLVETHGRSETAALLEGLEILPRLGVEHRGHALEEFDLDAALARKPAILIVDEMAHSNPDGARHPKRYQDIAELLDSGIDVWTALNIQHLESLSDLVTRIAGVEVREIVPDIALKRADEVILVDLPPAELIERLRDGKVYLPENARRAMEGFFRPATLTALRELALRRTADRVDDQMVDLLRQRAIEGPWATAERLLVLVGSDALSEKVVRTASRLASGLNAPWTAISLGTTEQSADPEALRRIDGTLRLAERLGATTRRVTADDFAAEILRIARRENVTQIVVGRPRRSMIARLTRRSLPDDLLHKSGEINVHIVSGDEDDRGVTPTGKIDWRGLPAQRWSGTLGWPLASVAAATLVGLSLTEFMPLQNVSLLYLLAVFVCGVFGGRIAALIASGLAFLADNFFFIEPFHSFTVARPHEVFGLVVFLAAALLGGELAGRMREQAERSRRQERATQALNDFSRKLSGSARLDAVLAATTAHLYASTGLGAVLLVPEEGELVVGSIWPPDLALDPTDMTAARWAFDKREPAGQGSGTLPKAPWAFRPVLQGKLAVGVLGLLRPETTGPLLPHDEQLVRGVLEQTAVAMDRSRLVRANARTAALEEGEKLNSALFSSLSHDLKTPLATIAGAASSLRELGDRMDAPTRADLLVSIEEETGRLSRFVSNLFDMTRLEAGTLHPRRDTVEVGEVIGLSVDRARKLHPAQSFEISLADDMPAARADANLLGQVLFNLVDNAAKYGGGTARVAIFARGEGNEVVISVTDQGRGIPDRELERIFDKFYRRTKTDGRAAGTGLGLSIARGFVEAMGGTLKAESPAVRKRGTRFTIRLPAEAEVRA